MKKDRPALIINTDALGKLPLKIIAPITGCGTQTPPNEQLPIAAVYSASATALDRT
jgi:hypothetical protein